MWVSQHVTNEEVSVCEAAAVLVIADCPDECAACTPAGAGCTTGTDMDLVVKKFDAPALGSEGADGGSHVLAAVGLLMIVSGIFGLVGVRVRSRPSATISDDALLVEDDAADA